MSTYTSIRSEGGLIPLDMLDRIALEEEPGQKGRDFGLDSQRRLSDEISRAWGDALDYWHVFRRQMEDLPESDSGTTLTRERWAVRLLTERLGYKLEPQRAGAQVEGIVFPISHRAGEGEEAPPVHIVGFRQALDKRPEGGYRRLSPHAIVQEYLNRTEHLWAVATNGLRLRLLRDSTRTSRPQYLEFDLESILNGGQFNEFSLFYRLCHRTRLPAGAEDVSKCLLEQYYQKSIDEGLRVRDKLRDGVHEALVILGSGLLQHPDNAELCAKVESGKLPDVEYYRELLRLIYRLLFLMVAEERGMILATGPNKERNQRIYDEHYSVRSLRDRAEQPIEESPHGDLWIGLQQTFRLFDSSDNPLSIPPLNGDLFGPEAIPDLENTGLFNHILLLAVRHLSRFKEGNIIQRVNYAGLDVEELGSVYESLLDFQPAILRGEAGCKFELLTGAERGAERKSTGSYYTHRDLVAELIKSALEPVLEQRLQSVQAKDEKERTKQKEDAILSMSVCDPATGSGHFLVAAARRLGRELAKVRSGEDEPTPEQFREAVRDVIMHCIYGVDVNPLAVDLCKVSLWIEGYNVGRPLTFLDHRIRHGNSLLGTTPELMKDGIPDEAFMSVTGDVKAVASATIKENRKERHGQVSMHFPDWMPRLGQLAYTHHQIEDLPENTAADVRGKGRSYQDYLKSSEHALAKFTADAWCAAFFWPLSDAYAVKLTTEWFRRIEANPHAVSPSMRERVQEIADRHAFFHWPLEFPTVFERGGFDVVLGNPPWERIKLQEQEFFASRDPEIAEAPNKDARARLIQQLPSKNPMLAAEFAAALRAAEGESKSARHTGRFPLAGRGDINTYAVFAEASRQLLSPGGRAGIIIPPGIATDDTTKVFFGDVLRTQTLVALLGMDNEAMIYFPGIDHRNKFALVCLGGREAKVADPVFTFACSRLEYTLLPQRRFTLTADDIALLNPNSRTCPVFRTRADAELTKAIYRRVPILVKEARDGQPEENPWAVSFSTMFHMSNDSSLFKTAADFRGGVPDGYLPLYEAKMMHQFDHRWATYEGVTSDELQKGLARELTHGEKRDPLRTVQPRYWVNREEVEARLADHTRRNWLLGFRNIASNVVERTAIFAVLPRAAVGNSAPLLNTQAEAKLAARLIGNLSALVFDYVARSKIAGVNMNFFIVQQLSVLPPDRYTQADLDFIVPRLLELAYTAWDLKPFAEDLGYDGPPFTWDPDRRAVLRAELDAYYAHLYGLNRKQLRYILDPHGLSAKELEDVLDPWEDPTCSGPHLLPAEPALDFPGETFRVLKEKEERLYGEYRTRRLVLAAWHRLNLGNQ
jgi:hypothetical protein